MKKYINNSIVTMQEEWNADNSGFDNAVAAGFNPGGGAASMVKLRSIYGDLWVDGLKAVTDPNNHPKTLDRIHNFGKRLTDYSYGHITVKNDQTVQIDGKDIVTPVATSSTLAGERAYLAAGHLATIYHNKALGKAYVKDNGAVYINNQIIISPAQNDMAAQDIANKINAVTKQ